MEGESYHPHPAADNDESGIVRSNTDVPPAHDHYTFQIKNFSLLLGMKEEKCHSGQFAVGGYQWRLVLYPNGNKNNNGTGHISLYLEIAATDAFSLGWEVNVNIRFFVFDQIRDKYLTIQDASGRLRRFHKLMTERGFAQLLSHGTLKDSSNGYLVDDTCVFGVEVFVIKGTCRGETLSMVSQPQTNYFTWRFYKYTTSKDNIISSEQFTVEGRKWNLYFYPEGEGTGVDKYTSLYLRLDENESLPPNRKLYAKYKLRIRDQINSNHLEKTVENWFYHPYPNNGYRFRTLLSKRDLEDASKGYLVGDCLFAECKIDVISVVKDFS